ncbi:unnamed protein product [Toxocara canis]|uniref:Uncharacterized protein n=1 Tax=Toxocara canis TaxID=6265 RepID=A0A183V8M9_TOXCA|nr:unnamed protein product [Toxocara canis]
MVAGKHRRNDPAIGDFDGCRPKQRITCQRRRCCSSFASLARFSPGNKAIWQVFSVVTYYVLAIHEVFLTLKENTVWYGFLESRLPLCSITGQRHGEETPVREARGVLAQGVRMEKTGLRTG